MKVMIKIFGFLLLLLIFILPVLAITYVVTFRAFVVFPVSILYYLFFRGVVQPEKRLVTFQLKIGD